METDKEVKKIEKDISQSVKKNANFWAIAAIVLAVLLVIVLIYTFAFTGISKSAAQSKVLTFLDAQSQGQYNLSAKSVVSEGSLYIVTVLINGEQEFPVYITKDGKKLISPDGVVPLEQTTDTTTPTTTPKEVPKSDKPVAELFVWGYCPYGVAAQAPFAEVAKLLGNSVDFSVKLYYAGHGPFEAQQNKIQACIQKYEPTKYWNYAINFTKTIYPKCGATQDISCDKTESTTLMNSLGINSNKILECVTKEGETLTAADAQRAQAMGVTGSPSLVVNNVLVNAGRDAESYKQAICSAFNNAPSTCNSTLSSAQATTTGNC